MKEAVFDRCCRDVRVTGDPVAERGVFRSSGVNDKDFTDGVSDDKLRETEWTRGSSSSS